ncbi:DegT/DnrJ/EryC1/StrS aminotransferase family protein, partial [bacterium]|nr:DegT/DnrJ/EryC1/StrS aminotransferase family protein [candidate division CSSED10-310 bacterium]
MDTSIPHSKPYLGQEEVDAVLKTLASGNLSSGNQVHALEDSLSTRFNRPSCVVSSGTAALHLALLGLGIGKGAKVAIPTHTCPSLLYVLQYVNAEPVLFDCGPLGIGIDMGSLEMRLLTVDAIIVVHTYGFPVPLAKQLPEKTVLIEDCAHSIGATISEKSELMSGAALMFSFYPTKMMCGGECGAVVGSTALIDFIKQVRSPRGADSAQTHYPYSPNELCAAIANQQFQKLNVFIEKRRQIAAFYDASFAELPITIPWSYPSAKSVYYRYVIETPKPRDEVIKRANELGVRFGFGVKTPLHRLLKKKIKEFPNSEKAYKYSVSIPIYPGLS